MLIVFFSNLRFVEWIWVSIPTFFSTFFNYKKDITDKNFDNFINNLYLKKTLNYVINNLEPKYKKINHKIKSGETFDKILKDYSIDKNEITIINKCLNFIRYFLR